MLPFRKILFPVDYSQPCRTVVPYVREMVRRFEAQLALVHAYGPEALAFSELPITDPDLPEQTHAHEKQRLHDFALEMFPGQHVDVFAELGEAGAAIDKVVQHQGADLVTMATHGRGTVRRFLLGSVTAKVLHDLGTAVWTGVGTHLTEHPARIPYKSVLCAVGEVEGEDEGEEAEAVVRAAVEVAGVYGAELSLVHVVEMPPPTMEIDFSPYRQEVLDSADLRLRELMARLELNVPHVVLDSTVEDGVRQEAIRRQADLIVTGRGRAQEGFSRLWSRLYPIVRESPCPVLSI